jgi:hypothetical protein
VELFPGIDGNCDDWALNNARTHHGTLKAGAWRAMVFVGLGRVAQPHGSLRATNNARSASLVDVLINLNRR